MITSQPGLSRAIAEWRRVLGDAAVLTEQAAADHLGPGTTPVERQVPAVLFPASAEDVAEVVRIARRHRVPLYPVGRGHNWGFGDAKPAVDGCAVVELSRMDRVLEVDAEVGLATIEPGVTYGQLQAYLSERNLPWMAPTTGIGEIGCVVGNALERGFGGSYHDHFLAVTALQAVLPNGDTYRTPMTELGAPGADRAFKWGIGPYLDGMFSQGGFGIVTQATLALAHASPYFEYFIFQFEDQALERVLAGLVEARRAAYGAIGEFAVCNTLKELAKRIAYPSDQVRPGETIPPGLLGELAASHELWDWTGYVPLRGTPEMVAAVRQLVERHVLPHVGGHDFVTPADGYATGERAARLAKLLPAEHSLAVTYFRPGAGAATSGDPARDGCGLYWYSPVVPLKVAAVRAQIESAERVCRAHGIEPIVTFVAVGDKAISFPLPLLFDRFDAESSARAHACYRALLEEGKRFGGVPARTSYPFMDRFVDPSTPYWSLVKTLSQAMDPDGLMAPGRYRPL